MDSLQASRISGGNTAYKRAASDFYPTPPFRLAADFIRRCAEYGKPFALLLKAQFWNAAKRYKLFLEITPTRILPLTWRPDFTGKGQAMMDMTWNIWTGRKNEITMFCPLRRPTAEEMEMLEGME